MNAQDRTTLRRMREALEAGGEVVLANVTTQAALSALKAVEDELRDYAASFTLYSNATRALTTLYKTAHPNFPENAWPDTGVLCEWARGRIVELEAWIATLKTDGHMVWSLMLRGDIIKPVALHEGHCECRTCFHIDLRHESGKCSVPECTCAGWV